MAGFEPDEVFFKNMIWLAHFYCTTQSTRSHHIKLTNWRNRDTITFVQVLYQEIFMKFSHAVASLAFFLSSIVAGAPALAQNVDGLNAGGSDSSSNEETNINTGSESRNEDNNNWEFSPSETHNYNGGDEVLKTILRGFTGGANSPGVSHQPAHVTDIPECVNFQTANESNSGNILGIIAWSNVNPAEMSAANISSFISCKFKAGEINGLMAFAQSGGDREYIATAAAVARFLNNQGGLPESAMGSYNLATLMSAPIAGNENEMKEDSENFLSWFVTNINIKSRSQQNSQE